MKIYFGKNKKKYYTVATDEEKYCRPYALHNSTGDFAVIDVDGILRYSKRKNFDFNELFSHAVSHEQIHSLIEKMFSFEVSIQFDSLYKKIKNSKSPFHILGTGL